MKKLQTVVIKTVIRPRNYAFGALGAEEIFVSFGAGRVAIPDGKRLKLGDEFERHYIREGDQIIAEIGPGNDKRRMAVAWALIKSAEKTTPAPKVKASKPGKKKKAKKSDKPNDMIETPAPAAPVIMEAIPAKPHHEAVEVVFNSREDRMFRVMCPTKGGGRRQVTLGKLKALAQRKENGELTEDGLYLEVQERVGLWLRVKNDPLAHITAKVVEMPVEAAAA